MDKTRQQLMEQFNPIKPLIITHANTLDNDFPLPDELIQDFITTNGLSVLYGDSNSGKTFLAIDMACAIARGIPWMNRQTEQGLILYLATESPSSVKMRLKAYQNYFGLTVPNFLIVEDSINLFLNDSDMNRIIKTIHDLEKQTNQKVRLIIGDTLARLSVGANENSGEDMGLIMTRIDIIHNECKTHFSLIHHTGKNASAGARGWSGIRAFIDTEVEITDTPLGKCAEITKQRDLNTKGQRIGFRLVPTVIGISKWKQPVTSCIVQSMDAPIKQSKPLSEVAGAILEYLREKKEFVSSPNLVRHFKDTYSRSGLFHQLKKLTNDGKITNNNGYYGINLISQSEPVRTQSKDSL